MPKIDYLSEFTNPLTGEVTARFRSMYDDFKPVSQDLSNPLVDVYEEIPPYAVDLETGELLNKTSFPIVKKIGQKDIQKEIQSYADECDIYKLIERVAISGNSDLLKQRVGNFVDYINLPDNLNDFNAYVKKAFADENLQDKELVKLALKETLSSDEFNAYIQQKFDSLVKEKTNNNGGQE